MSTKQDIKNGDNGVEILAKVVVGSRLHGLDTPTSDWDYRGIHLTPFKDFVSPFKKNKNTTWIEGDEDNTSYELGSFCQSATVGNATILEVFFSDQIIEDSPEAQEMRENWKKFIDTNKFVQASLGYAHNQYNKFYNFESIGVKGQERTAKFAISYLRVLWQCEQFLLTGEFKCNLKESQYYELMKKIKPMTVEEIRDHLAEITVAMLDVQNKLSEALSKTEFMMTPDIPWIEDFISRTYLKHAV